MSFGLFCLKSAAIFGLVKSMRPNKDTLFKNSSKNALFVYALLTIFAALSAPIILRTIPLLQVIHSRCWIRLRLQVITAMTVLTMMETVS